MPRQIDLSPEQAEQIIRHFTPTLRMVRLLGSGSFGQVFLVADETAQIAVKIIPLQLRQNEKNSAEDTPDWEESHEWRQLQYNWDRLHHTSLVRIRACHAWQTNDEADPIASYGLVYMDYWPYDLYDCVKELARTNKLTPLRCQTLLIQLALLLQRLLDDVGLMVTDLKLENIMVTGMPDGPFQMAMIDLGGVCEARLADYHRVITTDFYMAPELLDHSVGIIDEQILIYGFGMIGMFILEGRWPVEGYDYLKPMLPKLREQGGPQWSAATGQTMAECVKIIETCLCEKRASRTDASLAGERFHSMSAVLEALRAAQKSREEHERALVMRRYQESALLWTPKIRATWHEPVTGMEFHWIPRGKFMMGQSDEENKILRKQEDAAGFDKWFARELPRHRVELDGFWIGRFPVMRAEFAQFVEESLYQTDRERMQFALRSNEREKKRLDKHNWRKTRFAQTHRHPVVYISWFDAMAFVQWLSRCTGYPFSLPTEAQWEYACRGGGSTAFSFGQTIRSDQANYYGEAVYGEGETGIYRRGTTPCGMFAANYYGLHEMHGNVWEWCIDKYDERFYSTMQAKLRNPVHRAAIAYRIKRGGSWRSSPDLLRSAYRGGSYPDTGKEDTGFRLILPGSITNGG
ncbi:MAG: SUMF1/EgtB/PvdO family nonheme iron enzyme [Magnetococcales bacterium]|nr:SUMF1/EgtB/PvdO family nonheme iron enzyme [Magnetococcales bacterium]